MSHEQALKSLLEMGCNPILSQAAVKKLKTDNLSALLDWVEEQQAEESTWAAWLKEQPASQATGGTEGPPSAGQSISHLINKGMAEQLIAMNFSTNVTEKALLFTNNASVEKALEWIEEHKTDADFEEEVRMEGNPVENRPQLSPEEIKQKVKELTEKAREKRRIRQEEDERERERQRMKYGKEMVETKRIAEEQAMRRKIELDKIEKKRDEEYKRKLFEQIDREKGIFRAPSAETAPKKLSLSPIQLVQIQCEQVKVGNYAYPQVATTFFDTAIIYLNNVLNNNGEEKFRRINKENKAFQGRIVAAFAGVETLESLGYSDEGGQLVMKEFDKPFLLEAKALLERYRAVYG